MNPTYLIQFFVLIPILGFIISLLIPKKNETLLSRVAFFTIGIHLLFANVFSIYWLCIGHPTLNLKEIELFKTEGYEFYIDFCFDKVTVVYAMVGSILTFLVTVYSRYYMHRESGYKRFFNTVLFFFIGYNITVFSGNLETLFIGWEILGISSFLLIAFYRDRYLPVKNAFKVFSVYRIGDIGLILGMWMCHHLWHENITFLKLSNYELVHEHLQEHSYLGIFISLMILLSALAKSGQLPFSSWLPRAMEGPTPSSAIFYGSLSVHIGVFLLIRTMPFWEQQTSVRILIGVMGLSTSLVASAIARVQSSVKSQIAYSSVAQIGIMFIEVALGFETLALFHFASNAFLRTYQLLVSPSVVSYLIKEQFYNFTPRKETIEDSLPKKLEYTIYMLSLKEFHLDSFINFILWNPLKKLGKIFNFITYKILGYVFAPIFIVGIISYFNEDRLSPTLFHLLPTVFAIIGLMMVLKAFSERKNTNLSWLLIILNHFWIALAISFNEHYGFDHTMLYLSGIIVAGIIGFMCIHYIKMHEKDVSISQFRGYISNHPKIGLIFLMCCLTLSGFPISPTHIGEDIIFSHIHENQVSLVFFVSLSFIVDGLAVIRLFARLFLGVNENSEEEVPFKSS